MIGLWIVQQDTKHEKNIHPKVTKSKPKTFIIFTTKLFQINFECQNLESPKSNFETIFNFFQIVICIIFQDI